MISDDDVKKVAGLARIHLREDEVKQLGKDLGNILDYVKKLEKLDVEGVQPTSHALPMKNVFREDVVVPSLSNDEALQSAPDKKNGSFKVPKVIE